MQATLLKQWQLLLVYNGYRIFCALFFLFYLFFSQSRFSLLDTIFLSIILGYLISGIILIYLWYIRYPGYDQQVMIFGAMDIVFITGIISFMGFDQSGFLILLNVTVAALSILAPGRLAIFFAALASSILLGISAYSFAYMETHDLRLFYLSGISGVSIFASAFTAWYLAHWVRISDNIAMHRAEELAGMQRINEYIVERLHSGVIFINLNRQIKFFNSVVRTLFNLDIEKPYLNLVQISKTLDRKCCKFINQISNNPKPVQSIIHEPYLRVFFYAVEIDFQMAVLIFLEDMTSIAQQAQQLKLASLGRFSASIAHELRNPLGAIFHAVQLLGESDPLGEEDNHLKQLIINNCNRMNNVIKNILQLSRHQKTQPKSIEFHAFMEQFKRDFSVYNQCNIVIEKNEDKEVFFVFDRSQLEQIMVILCDNAIHHACDANGHVKIVVKIKQNSANTEIFITDSGPGIPEALKFNIFEPFFSTKHTGVGMGLFIARDLCEINQARLFVQTGSDGACFVIAINQSSERSL